MHPSIYFFALGHLATDWSQGAIPALLPYFIARFGLSYQEAGLLVFANVLIASVMQPLFGYYSDKVSKPWFVPLGPLICGPLFLSQALPQAMRPFFCQPSAAA